MAKSAKILPVDKPIPLPAGSAQLHKPLGEAKALAFGVPPGTTLVSKQDPLAETKSGVTPAAYAQMRAGVIGVGDPIGPEDQKVIDQAAEIEKLKERIATLEAGQTPPPAPATGGVESLTGADVLGKRKLEAAGIHEKQTTPEVEKVVVERETVKSTTPPRRQVPRTEGRTEEPKAKGKDAN